MLLSAVPLHARGADSDDDQITIYNRIAQEAKEIGWLNQVV